MTREAEAIEILLKVRERIADPRHWTQGANARDTRGKAVGARNVAAVAWCVYGAVLKEGLDPDLDTTRVTWNALDRAAGRTGYRFPLNVNDDGTHPEVLIMLDSAVADLRVMDR